MKYFPILTPQNVQVQFELATVGHRLLAFLIDMVVKFIYIYGLSSIGLLSAVENAGDSWTQASIAFIILLPVMFYTLVSEYFFNGQTLGKKILKLKVVSMDSYTNTFEQYFIRWIFNLIDVFVGSGIIGLLSASFTKYSQRLGDLASGSIVIDMRSKVDLSDSLFVELSDSHQVTFSSVTLLSDRDMQIIKQVWVNAKKGNNSKLIKKLRRKIESLIPLESKLNDYDFIETVIEDYNFLTMNMD